ncbi:DJ-1 family glyoxalase III [Saccharicrinis aurantiacus]|uniref:DJ-1 family glyoxalase III n=1 Tax=Saccharicrinis aurantiacus TaxID=1849719 RepID=UPI00249037F9|nr:DJ-1 family glyoxalase III [Saccharicrinis aurantiacus]
MKKVYIFVADGFEEIELITPLDVLRRAELDVVTVSISEKKEVTGAHNVTFLTDALFSDSKYSDAELLLLPGGMPGAKKLNEHTELKELVASFNKRGKTIAAICAAPIVLGGLGILKRKNATCYPGFEAELEGANITGEAVEVDKNIITAKGPGAAMYFSLAIVTKLCGEQKAIQLAKEMVLAGTY